MNNLTEHHDLYENARARAQQKKRLYYHFVVFLVGSVFLILLNKFLKVGENVVENWFVWAIILWFFFFVLHFINVFVTHRFMGKDWERAQTEKLVMEQELKIAKFKKQIDEEYALKVEKTQELYNFEKDKKEGDLSNATEEW